jgi:23S rRNA pseudouridine1911/1915/1917 synthase
MDNEQITKLTFEIDAAANKQKLGDYLFDNMRDLSKMYLRELIKTGKCEVNGTHVNSGYRLRESDFVEIEADLSRGTAMRPENITLDIVFEDPELIVVNKPAGMLVHPSHRENSGTMLNALSFYLNANSSILIRPGLPHRLDKQTSGLIVIVKTARAHRILSGHFMKKRVEKLYLALVDGMVKANEGSMNAPIGRFAELKYWGVKDGGKLSETKFRVRERFAETTLLELEPVTGRTNQLRIHCQMIGHPIVGDTLRGGREFSRLCLHAWRLAFPHPSNGERMEFQADIPEDFAL